MEQIAPLMTWDRRDSDGYATIGAAEADYARLLYASGYGAYRIADLLGCDRLVIHNLARLRGWVHRTPCRFSAPIGCRIPVLVRCDSCAARFGDVLGAPRPCPHCGSIERGATDG